VGHIGTDYPNIPVDQIILLEVTVEFEDRVEDKVGKHAQDYVTRYFQHLLEMFNVDYKYYYIVRKSTSTILQHVRCLVDAMAPLIRHENSLFSRKGGWRQMIPGICKVHLRTPAL
jgi:hypothetical protein